MLFLYNRRVSQRRTTLWADFCPAALDAYCPGRSIAKSQILWILILGAWQTAALTTPAQAQSLPAEVIRLPPVDCTPASADSTAKPPLFPATPQVVEPSADHHETQSAVVPAAANFQPAGSAPFPESVPVPGGEPVVFDAPDRGGPFVPDREPWYESNRCPDCQPWLRVYQGSSYGLICPCPVHDRPGFSIDGLVRGYYINDQRINWSGMETTFGAEGILAPRFIHEFNDWNISANSVFFINQPFDGNMLNEPGLQSYHKNFDVNPFQVWNLNVRFTKGDFSISFGKDNTPFGRYYFPVFTNSRIDSPFLRSEVIKWVETGIFARYSPGIFVGDLAITNGVADRDTNSMKALIARAGIKTPWLVAGVSGKLQDGSGSEGQKEYGSYYGFDAMTQWGSFDLSGEVTYDQYGLWHNFDPNNITWGRSLYYRDLYSGKERVPLSGVGYYVNLGWTRPNLRVDLNYGEYYPNPIGNVLNDTPVRRGLTKWTWLVMPHVESYTALIWENVRPLEDFRHWQLGFAVLTGAQVYF